MARPDTDARRDDRRAARRAQLLDDAIEAIRSIGPGATMEQLARRGGVTKPILYRHFRDRDGLIKAIADRFSAELIDEIEVALQSTTSPRELVERTIDAYLALVERDPSLYRFLLQQVPGRAAPGRPEGTAQISPLIDTIARRVAVAIGDGLREAGGDSGAAVPWSYGIVGLVHAAGDWWLDARTMRRTDLTAYLTSLVWDGLGAAAPGQEG